MKRRDNFGVHIISDLYQCDPEKLTKIKEIEQFIEKVVEKSGLTKIKSYFHQFSPYGFTALVLLSESHLAIHTWPEYGYVSLDVYSCGPPDSSFSAHKKIVDFFRPKKTSTRVITRGKLDESCEFSDVEKAGSRKM